MDARGSGWIGTIVGNRWRIDAKIARGGVATVYRASERGGADVAIKIMHPEYSRNQDARGRFLREGYVANKVGHPGVVRVISDGITPDQSPYLVMEFLEDGELLETKRERLGGRLPAEEVCRYGEQLLDILAAAHGQGIIHRDIKPENIFILSGGTVKVLDFGIAHLKEAAMRAEPTATGLLLGTPDFMSPEQAQGMRGTIDAQTDVYAVGATLFTLLSAEAVHVEQALGTLLHATASKQARSLTTTRAAREHIPPALIAVVDKSLMLLKPQRWASAREMQEALRNAMPVHLQKPKPLNARVGLAPRPSVKPPAPGAPQGVKAVSMKPPRPAMEEPKPPSERTIVENGEDSPWLKPFAPGEMEESATVAMKGSPPALNLGHQETQALDPSQLPFPPPPRTPSMMPPPISLAPPTPPMHQLPQPQPYASMPPPPMYGSVPQATPQRPSMPPPGYAAPFHPPTPRGQQWSEGVRPIAISSPRIVQEPRTPAKASSILVAEIVLAALVVITLTIGGCLLLR